MPVNPPTYQGQPVPGWNYNEGRKEVFLLGPDGNPISSTNPLPGNITKWAGTALTARDISQDLAKLDLALSALRDAITGSGAGAKTLADVHAAVDGLEGFTDQIETLLTDLKGLVDGLEGMVDGLEAAAGAPGDAVAGADLAQAWNQIQLLKAVVEKLRGTLTVSVSGTAATSDATAHAKLDTIAGHVDLVETKLDTLIAQTDTLESLLGGSGSLKAADSRKTWAGQNTTNDYADLGSAWSKGGYRTSTVIPKNTGANGAHVKVLGSVDGGTNFDVEIQAETTIAAGDQLVVKFSDYYTDVKVQIKAAVADSQTTVEGRAAAVAA